MDINVECVLSPMIEREGAEALENAKLPNCKTAKGILQECEAFWTEEEVVSLPTIPDWVYETLPSTLKQIVAAMEMEEDTDYGNLKRDVVLIGALATLSSMMIRVSGLYLQKRYCINLYLYFGTLLISGLAERIDRRRESSTKSHELSIYAGSEGVLSLLVGTLSRTGQPVQAYLAYSPAIPTGISGKEVTL